MVLPKRQLWGLYVIRQGFASLFFHSPMKTLP